MTLLPSFLLSVFFINLCIASPAATGQRALSLPHPSWTNTTFKPTETVSSHDMTVSHYSTSQGLASSTHAPHPAPNDSPSSFASSTPLSFSNHLGSSASLSSGTIPSLSPVTSPFFRALLQTTWQLQSASQELLQRRLSPSWKFHQALSQARQLHRMQRYLDEFSLHFTPTGSGSPTIG